MSPRLLPTTAARRRPLTAVPTALACILWACGGEHAPTAVQSSYAGTYRLSSIDGQPPDTSVRDVTFDAGHPATIQFTSTVLILRPDSTAAEEQTAVQVPALPPPCTTTSHEEGTWHAEGTRVTIDLVAPARPTDCWTYSSYQYVGTVGTSGALTLQAKIGSTTSPNVEVFTRVP